MEYQELIPCVCCGIPKPTSEYDRDNRIRKRVVLRKLCRICRDNRTRQTSIMLSKRYREKYKRLTAQYEWINSHKAKPIDLNAFCSLKLINKESGSKISYESLMGKPKLTIISFRYLTHLSEHHNCIGPKPIISFA
jgi:hypothetical protein